MQNAKRLQKKKTKCIIFFLPILHVYFCVFFITLINICFYLMVFNIPLLFLFNCWCCISKVAKIYKIFHKQENWLLVASYIVGVVIVKLKHLQNISQTRKLVICSVLHCMRKCTLQICDRYFVIQFAN